MKDAIVLLEIGAYNLATGLAETLRFCDGLAYRLRPSEAPANAQYRPFLVDPGWCRVDVFNRPGQYGHVTPGEVMLDDSSGALGKQLIGYAFAGRSLVIRIGARGAAYPGDFVTVINGTTDGAPTFNETRITFRPADLSASLVKPFQQAAYAGTNALPNGLEGVDDLKGRVKPLVLALGSNMTPQLVNSAKLIYQVSAPIGAAAVTASVVRDRGVPLTMGPGYATLADLENNALAPAAGACGVLSTVGDGCFFRLGSSPVGGVTADAAYGNASDRTHAQVWKRILAHMGIAGGAISAADVAALDLTLPGEIECVVLDEAQADELLAEVAKSAGAAWYGDPAGVHRLTQWQAPAGAPAAVLTQLRTAAIDIPDTVGSGEAAPAYRVTLEYGRNWTVQPDQALGGDKTNPGADTVRAPGARAALAARAWLAADYRTAPATDATVQDAYPNAVELKLRSMLADSAQAQAFADAQLALYKVARHHTSLTQWLSAAQIDVVRPGAVVRVKHPRWNYAGGRLMRVSGVKVDRFTGKTELGVWG